MNRFPLMILALLLVPAPASIFLLLGCGVLVVVPSQNILHLKLHGALKEVLCPHLHHARHVQLPLSQPLLELLEQRRTRRYFRFRHGVGSFLPEMFSGVRDFFNPESLHRGFLLAESLGLHPEYRESQYPINAFPYYGSQCR